MAKPLTRSQLLRRTVERLPRIVWEEYGQRDTCIPASYHAAETLRSSGVPARVASMDAIAMNWPFAEWWMRREEGHPDPMPPWAWSVGVTHSNPDGRGYLSHLVCVSKGRILDCAAGQLSRPQRGMPVPAGLLVRGGRWSSETTLVTYRPSPEPVPPMWSLNPGATARTRQRIAAEILA
jgi:hypothetical protein